VSFQLGLVVVAGNFHLVECCVRSYFQKKEDGIESWDRMFTEVAERGTGKGAAFWVTFIMAERPPLFSQPSGW